MKKDYLFNEDEVISKIFNENVLNHNQEAIDKFWTSIKEKQLQRGKVLNEVAKLYLHNRHKTFEQLVNMLLNDLSREEIEEIISGL